ncbi:hypothetical protein [Pedobacter steynii]|uniref:Uncharacterized protein n=1 Tax=Pedobacter steynii TaxID=430522 RepID=A0A1D7QBC5_9SPHI|nr:hypothetical protein [Pedobacter steynii]AOM76000.1 hypothetical protein BFS30_01765 [Pedobacter steynii]
MPLTPCLSGPAFSIVGDSYFSDNSVNFQVSFDSPTAQESVLAYQWYLDESLVTEQQTASFNDKISCGDHSLGLRILSHEGWSGIKTIQFATCKLPASVILYGAASLNEGSSSKYYVFQLFSDGSNTDITLGYIFTTDKGGSFDGNLFKTLDDSTSYADLNATVTAVKAGAETLTKQVTILNTTPVTLVSLSIIGPDVIDNGSTTTYSVLGSYSDGSQRDVTTDFTFASTEGYFVGKTYTAAISGMTGTEIRQVDISALQNGFVKVTRQIDIRNKLQAGVLVVDFYNSPPLDLIGYVDNAEVTGHHLAAYTGNNIAPVGMTPENALVLASDHNPSSTSWRFEFNIDKLVRENPGTADFVFYIKGRSLSPASVSGVYALKTKESKMAMNGAPGSYMPTVIGGANMGFMTSFSNQVLGGMNGNYNQNYLPVILRFNYNVATATLSHTAPDPGIEVSDFDFMAVSYQWGEGAGSDLDILVGFENTGTQYDEVYVGYGQGNTVVPRDATPANTYLQWGTDNTGTNGYEGALIGMKTFLNAFPNLPEVVEVGLYAVWYSTPVTGNFNVELVTYKGGTMTHSGTNFVNTGGTRVSSNQVALSTMKKAPNSTLPSDYYKIGTVRYNKITASATIEIH